ncbi:MAG: 50S ribosomal protein L21 [Bdellovibrionota bacterium]
MYAVVRTGGKQYRVEPGSVIEVELLEGDRGAAVEFADVLLVGTGADVTVGRPLVKGAVVVGEIVEQKKAPKVIIYKKLKRHGHRLKKGHRQMLTRIRVQDIRVS